jgi:uncharacterized protein
LLARLHRLAHLDADLFPEHGDYNTVPMLPVIAGGVVAGVVVLAYASLIERHWFALRRHRVPCLPPGSAPLRVLHISDLHYRPSLRRMRRFVGRLAATSPDVVVGTGDFIGDPSSAMPSAELVTTLKGRLGQLFVLGSNDYYGPRPKNPLRYLSRKKRPHLKGPPNEWREFVEALEASGWRLINNATTSLDGIDIVGLDDPHIGRADLSVATERSADGFRLAVVHSPDAAKPLASLGYDLIVAGHTHGGQVRVPGVGALVTNCDIPRHMARGVHRVGGAWLHVSGGMGTSKYAPVRFACRPEACVLELVPREP